MDTLIQEAAIELAEAADAMLCTGKEHPVTQARQAYRAERQGPLEERYVQTLMKYRARKARAASETPPKRV